MLIAFNKPYGVLSQFTSDDPRHVTLAKFGFPKNVYPLGRLDADSEGLLLLSDEAELNAKLLNPMQGHSRTYWVQVENIPQEKDLLKLRRGVTIKGHGTLPCQVRILDPQPEIEERDPPIRIRKNIPTCWLEISLTEGKNRQVRRMTAAVGYPTLRLVRIGIGSYRLGGLKTGQRKILGLAERKMIFIKE
ncbi:MAG: pseudouridine synthase [Candidatus Edwardsbacteria bacterium]|nr:pseudouridine synthase [Candidatus Edwardsbacteria bacterium]MBU1577270.1 pseudouridine synthase [Candidatus Edwardsbacteria bacterium]MBU2462819.1 pseudouridine synthase [Candidatus Edwardsbacteria bacterium]MBU2594871.1 pseudouridine synthase [Candidatus Edwardsbacteria bacterium]